MSGCTVEWVLRSVLLLYISSSAANVRMYVE